MKKRFSFLILMFVITSCGMLQKPAIYSVKTDTIYQDVKLTDTLIYMDTAFIDTTICPAGLVRDSMIIDTIRIKGRTEYRTRVVRVPVVIQQPKGDLPILPTKGESKSDFPLWKLIVGILAMFALFFAGRKTKD